MGVQEVCDRSYTNMFLLLHAMDLKEKEQKSCVSYVSDYSYISKNGYTQCPGCLRRIALTNRGTIRKHVCVEELERQE